MQWRFAKWKLYYLTKKKQKWMQSLLEKPKQKTIRFEKLKNVSQLTDHWKQIEQ